MNLETPQFHVHFHEKSLKYKHEEINPVPGLDSAVLVPWQIYLRLGVPFRRDATCHVCLLRLTGDLRRTTSPKKPLGFVYAAELWFE